MPEVMDLGVGQNTRGYDPMEISHDKLLALLREF
jgi:hypothetical protein